MTKLLALLIWIMCLVSGSAWAEPDFNRLADAIYKAEGTRSHYPYGILAHYRHTSPRKACLNTIRHQYRLWLQSGRSEPYLTFLGHAYAPLNCSNDPKDINRNWLANVRRLYDQSL